MENLDGRFLPCGPLGLGKLEVRGVRPLARVGCREDGHFSQTQRGSMCTYMMIHALKVMVHSKGILTHCSFQRKHPGGAVPQTL